MRKSKQHYTHFGGICILKYSFIKRALFFFLLVIVPISCSSCKNAIPNVGSQYPWKVEKEELLFDISGKVTLSIESDTLTSTGATFVISNLGTDKAMYGKEYEVQIMIDNEWYSICESNDWTLEAIFLMPGDSDMLDIDWTGIYGELPASKYRLIKSYRLRKESLYSEPSYSDESYIYCEFCIP